MASVQRCLAHFIRAQFGNCVGMLNIVARRDLAAARKRSATTDKSSPPAQLPDSGRMPRSPAIPTVATRSATGEDQPAEQCHIRAGHRAAAGAARAGLESTDRQEMAETIHTPAKRSAAPRVWQSTHPRIGGQRQHGVNPGRVEQQGRRLGGTPACASESGRGVAGTAASA